MIMLVKPGEAYKKPYLEMLEFWKSTGLPLEPWVLREDASDFDAMIRRFEDMACSGCVSGIVPSSTYWIFEDVSGRIVGAVNIRHWLNEELLRVWGNIGCGIRSDERGKGYATRALSLALDKCRALRLPRVLLGCYKDNAASARVIQKCGGVLENEIAEGGKVVQRYWIALENPIPTTPIPSK